MFKIQYPKCVILPQYFTTRLREYFQEQPTAEIEAIHATRRINSQESVSPRLQICYSIILLLTVSHFEDEFVL